LRKLHQAIDAGNWERKLPDGDIAKADDKEDGKDDVEERLHVQSGRSRWVGSSASGGSFFW